MGTTDARLALGVLETLGQQRVPFALLHGRAKLREVANVTDVDAVVGDPVGTVIRRLKGLWALRGLHPIVVWPYDLAGVTVWCATRDAADAVQMDFLYDPAAVGRLGLDTGALLRYADHIDDLPELRLEAQLLYLWRKRLWKGQRERLRGLRAAARRSDVAQLESASLLVTGSRRTARELLGRRPLPPFFNRKHRPILRLRRVVARLRKPVGFWVHAEDMSVAAEVVRRFARFLPRCGLGAAPASRLALWWWYGRAVLPVRLRPGLFVSYGPLSKSPRPDLVVGSRSSEDACNQVVMSMASRY